MGEFIFWAIIIFIGVALWRSNVEVDWPINKSKRDDHIDRYGT